MGNNKYCHVEGYALVNFGRFSGENSFWPNCTPEYMHTERLFSREHS